MWDAIHRTILSTSSPHIDFPIRLSLSSKSLDAHKNRVTFYKNRNTMGKNPRDHVGRFSVSLPQALLRDLDSMVQEKGYDNRSLAIADMVRNQLVEHRQQLSNQEIAGTITLVYDHHKPHLQSVLTDIQHDHHDVIVSTMHVHLDHHNCLEVLVVRGKAGIIKRIADALIAAKGVKHGKLTITTTGKDLVG
jgi:CopG family nickel-responsive transcriptional regulator